MSDRTLNELANAEIVPDAGGSNSYMVRFGEGDYDTVNKSAKHVLILEDDVVTEDVVSHGGIMVEFNLDTDQIMLSDGNNEVRVPSDKQEAVLWAVHDEDGPRLNRLFDELYVPTVREGLMDMFLPRFRSDSETIKKTEDGWYMDGILLSWDASNSPTNIAETHVVRSGEAVPSDADKEAREISFASMGDTLRATAPHGQTYDISEVEAQFLASAALITEQDAGDLYDDELANFIEGSRVTAFTDERSGLHHNHSLGKHTLSMLGVTDEASSRLWYNVNDHTGVWELAMREEEFISAPIDVFEDAENDDERKWNKIHSTKEKAPIPKKIRADLEARYGA